MNQLSFEFAAIVAKAVQVAERIANDAAVSGDAWLENECKETVGRFGRVRQQILDGSLPTLEHTGLGISRVLSEWTPVDLYDAAKAIEDYYRDIWCTRAV